MPLRRVQASLRSSLGGPRVTTVDAVASKEVPKLAGADDVYGVLDFVRENALADRRQWVELDFRNVGKQPAQRQSYHWIEILSNELLGELAAARLIIRPPSTPRGRRALERSGLSFAIAQREPAATNISDMAGERGVWPPSDWSRTWSPEDPLFHRKLFRDYDEPDELIQQKLLTFLNPHRHASTQRLGITLARYQARAWVEKLLGHRSNERRVRSSDALQRLVSSVETLTYELVENLVHAFPRRAALGMRPAEVPRKSYVQLYTTSGGGASSYDRLHLVVADTGVGICQSLRRKLNVSLPPAQFGSQALLHQLLDGSLPAYGRAAGQGYKRIVEILDKHCGELHITTGSSTGDENGEAHRATLRVTDSTILRVEPDSNLQFVGTTAHAMIRLNV